MKKQILLLVMMLLPMVAMADAVEIDGVYYNLITKTNTAEVTQNPNKYKGSVIIPESITYNNVEYRVTSIGKAAFYLCSSLTTVSIPNTVSYIGELAFSGSTLSNVNLPNGLETIEKSSFSSCRKLKNIEIPESVTSIGENAFFNSTLENITIPNSVTNIGNYAFSYCNLTSIILPEGLE